MIVALVGKAFTGKTAVAKELESRGWVVLSFTDHLKELAIYALNSVTGNVRTCPVLSVADVLTNKPKYRRFIQEFGSLIGYDTDGGWLQEFLTDELMWGWDDDGTAQDYVIDNLRSSAQIEEARRWGAKVVGLDSSDLIRMNRSSMQAVFESDQHPIDGDLDVWALDCDTVLTNNDHAVSEVVDRMLAEVVDAPVS